MDASYQGASDVHVFPANLPLPGIGVLPVNAYLLMAEEPVLIDTGVAMDGDDFMAAVSSVVDPRGLKWVWLTHDDADHTGSIQRIMEAAPNAKLVTHGLAALRMATWWPVPMERVHAIRFGDEIHVGDRTLTAGGERDVTGGVPPGARAGSGRRAVHAARRGTVRTDDRVDG